MSHRVRLGNSSSTSLRDRSALLGTSSTTSSSLLPPSSSSTTNFTPRASSSTLTPPGSGRSTPFGYHHHHHHNEEDRSMSSGYGYGGGNINSGNGSGGILPAGHRYADDLENQNDEAIEGLSAKVKLLKDITVGIGNEVRESTKQLSQMNDAFAETGGILQGTFRRMNTMATKQGCRWLWYILFLIIVFWFFIVVWWFRK
ncbi:hypothetical protein AGABI1DRAFT_88422 [Agaricus bisporus var. burnettii JB137-S8]|uniref:t-SNARE coiled-coil homology domain-containing protein n=1 Tax=Agaricus bisporus var. burnettii (strain JB137-S8 / ATCC MYA-4627 / FGSC 10392) TaxID=597362 RepID=K5Y5N7_AGABU|nr:uncharacterized protein AGABI1DRAFT_88422 [Agaricus bisporus var. burnettii JB137-S8]EKM83430.1 hypothetical protein AGABI1DRAFT_88422 [Agaricus bisporus var. burnettii JB137-S8]